MQSYREKDEEAERGFPPADSITIQQQWPRLGQAESRNQELLPEIPLESRG